VVLIWKYIIGQADESELVNAETGFFRHFASGGLLGGFS
jgi:hypothetical protein